MWSLRTSSQSSMTGAILVGSKSYSLNKRQTNVDTDQQTIKLSKPHPLGQSQVDSVKLDIAPLISCPCVLSTRVLAYPSCFYFQIFAAIRSSCPLGDGTQRLIPRPKFRG